MSGSRQKKGGFPNFTAKPKTKSKELVTQRKEREEKEDPDVGTTASIHYMKWNWITAKQAHLEANLDKGSTLVLELPINSFPPNHSARFRLRIKDSGRFVRMYAIVSSSPVVPNQHNYAWASGLGTQLKDEKLQTFHILPQFLGKTADRSEQSENVLLEAGQKADEERSLLKVHPVGQEEQSTMLYIAIHNLSWRADYAKTAPKRMGRLDDRSPIFTPSDAASDLKPFSPTREEEALLLGKLPSAPVALVLDVNFLPQTRSDALARKSGEDEAVYDSILSLSKKKLDWVGPCRVMVEEDEPDINTLFAAENPQNLVTTLKPPCSFGLPELRHHSHPVAFPRPTRPVSVVTTSNCIFFVLPRFRFARLLLPGTFHAVQHTNDDKIRFWTDLMVHSQDFQRFLQLDGAESFENKRNHRIHERVNKRSSPRAGPKVHRSSSSRRNASTASNIPKQQSGPSENFDAEQKGRDWAIDGRAADYPLPPLTPLLLQLDPKRSMNENAVDTDVGSTHPSIPIAATFISPCVRAVEKASLSQAYQGPEKDSGLSLQWQAAKKRHTRVGHAAQSGLQWSTNASSETPYEQKDEGKIPTGDKLKNILTTDNSFSSAGTAMSVTMNIMVTTHSNNLLVGDSQERAAKSKHAEAQLHRLKFFEPRPGELGRERLANVARLLDQYEATHDKPQPASLNPKRPLKSLEVLEALEEDTAFKVRLDGLRYLTEKASQKVVSMPKSALVSKPKEPEAKVVGTESAEDSKVKWSQKFHTYAQELSKGEAEFRLPPLSPSSSVLAQQEDHHRKGSPSKQFRRKGPTNARDRLSEKIRMAHQQVRIEQELEISKKGIGTLPKDDKQALLTLNKAEASRKFPLAHAVAPNLAGIIIESFMPLDC